MNQQCNRCAERAKSSTSYIKNLKANHSLPFRTGFNTVRRADEILVLENGRITEQGAHSELMKRKGLYFEMYTAQAEGYNDK